jgi:hypothetical protein
MGHKVYNACNTNVGGKRNVVGNEKDHDAKVVYPNRMFLLHVNKRFP